MPEPFAPPLPPGRYVELPRRGRVWVHEARGPQGASTLVLLHGLSATAALNWFTAFPALSRRFHVVALDLRGHGRGIRSARPFRLEDCADDAVALADELGIDRFVPVGYSMGGPVAQLVWRRHPERVEGMVLCATSRNFRGGGEERLVFTALPGVATAARLVPPFLRREVMRRAVAARPDDPPVLRWILSEVQRHDPAVLVEAARALGSFSSHDWIGDVDVPVGVVVTLEDNLVPPHRQLKLARAIPGATIHAIDADHGACANRPDLFVPALLEASESVVRRARLVGSAC